MNRRAALQLLACLPVVGRLVPTIAKPCDTYDGIDLPHITAPSAASRAATFITFQSYLPCGITVTVHGGGAGGGGGGSDIHVDQACR